MIRLVWICAGLFVTAAGAFFVYDGGLFVGLYCSSVGTFIVIGEIKLGRDLRRMEARLQELVDEEKKILERVGNP